MSEKVPPFIGYVINLNHRIDRLKHFYLHPDAKYFERIPAIDKSVLKLIDMGDLEHFFDCEKYLNRESQPVLAGEVACTLSHLTAYRKIANHPSLSNKDFAVIAEDDVTLSHEFGQSVCYLLDILKTHSLHSDIIILQNLFDKECGLPLAEKATNHYYLITSPDANYFNYNGAALYLIRKSKAKEITQMISSTKPHWVADGFTKFCPIEALLMVSPLLGKVDTHSDIAKTDNH